MNKQRTIVVVGLDDVLDTVTGYSNRVCIKIKSPEALKERIESIRGYERTANRRSQDKIRDAFCIVINGTGLDGELNPLVALAASSLAQSMYVTGRGTPCGNLEDSLPIVCVYDPAGYHRNKPYPCFRTVEEIIGFINSDGVRKFAKPQEYRS